jgi:hypothetical protein
VSDFLSWLASERNVTAATQNQALSSLLYLYRRVLGITLPWLDDMVRAARRPRSIALPSRMRTMSQRRLRLGRACTFNTDGFNI